MDPTPLPTTNATGSIADKTVGNLINDLVPLAEAAAITSQPWLAWPVLKQFWEAVFGWFVGLFAAAAGKVTGYIVLDIQSYFALKNANSALIALQAAQKSGDPNALTQANSDADAALASVLHYHGSV